MEGAIPEFSQYAFMAWCLVNLEDNFTLPYPLDGRLSQTLSQSRHGGEENNPFPAPAGNQTWVIQAVA
jgi:hypothetical protein